ncbi:MAG: hypothetical protein WC494_01250 [Candidatus Pacearchaeota archaeon]
MDYDKGKIISRIIVLREEVVRAYKSFLGMPPEGLSDRQIATEVGIYSARNSDGVLGKKCSELLELVGMS